MAERRAAHAAFSRERAHVETSPRPGDDTSSQLVEQVLVLLSGRPLRDALVGVREREQRCLHFVAVREILPERSSSAALLTVRFADIGLGATAAVRNVWSATDVGAQTTSYSVDVPAQDSVLLLVSEGG